MTKTASGLRPRIWDYRWLHSSIPFSAKKKRNLFNPPLWCSFGGRPGTAGIHHRPKKSTEHTEPGGALALACREEGQLASEQEVLGLIGQRETPLGRRSQRSVGTTLAQRLACGALMENGRGDWEFSVDLRLWTAATTQQDSPSDSVLTISDSLDWQLSELHVCCTLTLLHFLMGFQCQYTALEWGSFTLYLTPFLYVSDVFHGFYNQALTC